MKKDILVIIVVIIVLLPFFLFESVYNVYAEMNAQIPYITAFAKFAVLATFGEMLGMRIKTGIYNEKGFGIAPRAIIWGLLGIWIASAFRVFATGAPILAESFGVEGVAAAMKGDFTITKLFGAFMISLMMNTTFAPVFMTIHKITDSNILKHGGSLKALVSPINFGESLSAINWNIQWGFVFKKTIPLFWIPMHTITFLLPTEFQILFAALLGVALGVILSIAAVRSRKSQHIS